MIPSAIFVLKVALHFFVPDVALFSLFSNFSRNLASKPKTPTSTHVLSTSKQRKTGILVKSIGECCGSTALTTAC